MLAASSTSLGKVISSDHESDDTTHLGVQAGRHLAGSRRSGHQVGERFRAGMDINTSLGNLSAIGS